MKTILGVASWDYPQHWNAENQRLETTQKRWIEYLKIDDNGQLVTQAHGKPHLVETIDCYDWGIFPSRLKKLLSDNGVSAEISPDTDTEFLDGDCLPENDVVTAIYCAGERLALELGLNSPAICWQDAIKALPDSETKNLVWLAAEKFLQHMRVQAVKL